MMHTSQNLYDNLGMTLLEINKQMDAIKKGIYAQVPEGFEPARDEEYTWKDRTGKPLLSDMLLAKAQCLSAMAALKVEQSANRRPGTPGRGKW